MTLKSSALLLAVVVVNSLAAFGIDAHDFSGTRKMPIERSEIIDSSMHRPNILFLEFAGNCVYPYEPWYAPWLHFSINYERPFLIKERYILSARIGSNFPFPDKFGESHPFITVAMLQLQLGKRKMKFEVGAGAHVALSEYSFIRRVGLEGVLGLRFKPICKRFQIRIAFTPDFGISNGKINMGVYFGSSVGYTFNTNK